MKSGEHFIVPAIKLLEPLTGTLVELEYGGEKIKARITTVFRDGAELTVVPNSTKE